MGGPANIPDVHYYPLKFGQMTAPGSFRQLNDVPDEYDGQGGKVISVKNDETGLEFSSGGGVGGNASLKLTSSADSTDPVTHPYTADNCGVQVTNANDVEILRIWASDPDVADNWNSANLYIGYQAGLAQPHDQTSAGFENTGIGYQALLSTVTSANNTALGNNTLKSTVDSGSNVAVGSNALPATTSGSGNVGIGYQTLFANTTGGENVAIGHQALGGDFGSGPVGNTTGNFNTAVGSGALSKSAAGTTDGNTALGFRAGESSSGDVNCLYLGKQAGGTDSTPKTNAIAIGYLCNVDGDNRAVIGNLNVTDVFFGSETGAAKLHGKGDAIVFPDADPHVAGAAYWVAGVLTKSAG